MDNFSQKERRKWRFTHPPSDYDIAPCTCGNKETQWSEYAGHLWCGKCQIDFIPAHGGIFDGPSPSCTVTMMGLSLDRVNIETNEIDRYDFSTGKYESEL